MSNVIESGEPEDVSVPGVGERHVRVRSENWLEIAEQNRPPVRLVKPWEVANAIAFCLSDESASATTAGRTMSSPPSAGWSTAA